MSFDQWLHSFLASNLTNFCADDKLMVCQIRCKFMGQVFDPPGGFESKSSLEPNSGAQNLYELIWPQSGVMSEATAHNHIKCEHTTLHKSWQGYSVPPGTHFNVCFISAAPFDDKSTNLTDEHTLLGVFCKLNQGSE